MQGYYRIIRNNKGNSENDSYKFELLEPTCDKPLEINDMILPKIDAFNTVSPNPVLDLKDIFDAFDRIMKQLDYEVKGYMILASYGDFSLIETLLQSNRYEIIIMPLDGTDIDKIIKFIYKGLDITVYRCGIHSTNTITIIPLSII